MGKIRRNHDLGALCMCFCKSNEISAFDSCGARVPVSLRTGVIFGGILIRSGRIGAILRPFRPVLGQRHMDSASKTDPEVVKIRRFGQNPRKSSMRTWEKSAEITILERSRCVFAKTPQFQLLTAAEHVPLRLCALA